MSNDWAIDNPTWHDVEDACKLGAKWQEKQDQSTIELAEDHAMLAGMEKMKEEMMAKAVETTFNVLLSSGLYDKLWIKGCKEGDKLLVIKKDEI
jgi:phosphoribosyl-AMP cyclohydrolase